jgi:predicted RNA binding protein YcfA (HicA-like mRNA interferase family)
MRPFEVHKYLEQNGFQFHREGSKHRIYRNGKKQITVPRHRTIRNSTTRIIEKFVREAVAAEKGLTDVSAPQENELEIPEAACDDFAGELNNTSLPPSLYEVFRDFVHFCEENCDKAGEYNIRDILIQNGHQLPDWNALINLAKANQDVDVLFDLKDAADSMKITSLGLKTALEEIEAKTAPQEKEEKVEEDFRPARIVANSGETHAQRPKAIIPPLQTPVPRQSFMGYSSPTDASAYSQRQRVYLEVIQILGCLPPSDAQLVLKQAQGFVEMG